MPFSCIYPGCGLKRKLFHQESFHELPYRHQDQELLQQWMVVLNMDITTPVETLKKKRYRVCSRHFDKDDFIHPRTGKRSKGVHRVRVLLRRNAIPRVGPPATDTVERPQSTPIKSQDTASKSRLAGLTFSLMSPESSDVRPRTQRSLSGIYMARTPTFKLSEPEDMGATSASCTPLYGAPVEIPELRDSSAVMDKPPDQVRSSGIQGKVSETCTATMEKPALQHIVDEEAILQLMKDCPMCGRKCRCTKQTKGPFLIVYQSCYFCNYQRKWANQPEVRNMNFKKKNKARKRCQPKEKVPGNATAESPELNKTNISESSVSESHDLVQN
ncbi:uncharacterized protein LOC134864637 isoform X1 [Eleginops maclovinus]|uniref:uncharacterized protein LOC134864637 isoform X1 n=1 Tax=Eleginops maclovinus TaxID=56733 RepID=UPI00307FE207